MASSITEGVSQTLYASRWKFKHGMKFKQWPQPSAPLELESDQASSRWNYQFIEMQRKEEHVKPHQWTQQEKSRLWKLPDNPVLSTIKKKKLQGKTRNGEETYKKFKEHIKESQRMNLIGIQIQTN